jgi:hypothetical protein
MRFLLEQECGGNVGGVRVGWDVSEEVGRVWKYAIFIAWGSHLFTHQVFTCSVNWWNWCLVPSTGPAIHRVPVAIILMHK